MRVNRRTLANTSLSTTTYAGVAKNDAIELPQDFACQRIIIDYTGTATFSATSTLVQDALQACISSIQVSFTGSGIVSHVNVSGPDLYIKNFYDYHQPMKRIVPTSGSAVDVELCLVIDFRLDKRNPDDFSVAKPFYAYSDVQLLISYVAMATGYGSNMTSISLTGTISLIEAVPETSKEKTSFLTVRQAKLFTKTATYGTGTSFEDRDKDIIVGTLIRQIHLITYDASSGLRADGEIDYILWFGLATFNWMENYAVKAIQNENRIDGALPLQDGQPWLGVYLFDFAKDPVTDGGVPIGLPTVGLKSGDIKIRVNKLVASSNVRYLYETLD